MELAKTVRMSHLFNGNAKLLPDASINSVEYDSRRVVPGSCFVAVKGFSRDGHRYVSDAVQRGAALIVVEGEARVDATGVPLIRVNNTRKELARIADRFYGHPSAMLGVIGITGTNGKTTISYFIQKLLNAAGFQTSRFGTVEYDFPDGAQKAGQTTPESSDLQRMFGKAASWPKPRCVLEASSHGLALGRLEHTLFKGAVLTNVTQDHLDFHHSMEEYAKSKKRLFIAFEPEYAVINVDDPIGESWIKEGINHNTISYGFSSSADVRCVDSKTGITGSEISFDTPVGRIDVFTKIPGNHNISNVAATIAVGLAEGFDKDLIARSIASLEKVPGRFERIDEGQSFGVVVDYAHTDNALASALQTARQLTEKRLICVFGCGGDRDTGKRKLMGAVVGKFADLVVITSDNPRSEEPLAIINDILKGFPKESMGKTSVIPSRREAIEHAIKVAGTGDIVLIAGKGHEDYQIIGDARLHFDDREAATDILRELR